MTITDVSRCKWCQEYARRNKLISNLNKNTFSNSEVQISVPQDEVQGNSLKREASKGTEKAKKSLSKDGPCRLYRSRSLPAHGTHWKVLKDGLDPKDLLGTKNVPKRINDSWATLLQHYYPEGGWGWIILGISVTINILCHGLHMGFGTVLRIAVKKFDKLPPNIGEYFLRLKPLPDRTH